MKPYYQDKWSTIYLGDCLEVLPELEVESVDLVLTDPPYGKISRAAFDHKWTSRPMMLESCRKWLEALIPMLKANGTLYWFAWPSLAGRIEALIAEKLTVLAHIVWIKPGPRAQKNNAERLRAPAAETERILMAEPYGVDNMALGEFGYAAKCDELRGFVFEPLRAYLAGEFSALGWNADKLNSICGTASMAGRHYTARSQWCLPTEEHYNKLQEAAGGHLRREYEDLRREYEDLRREYEDLRREYEDLRRFFDLKTGDQKTDVWRFKAAASSLAHPTVKPLDLISYMVRLSCRHGGMVLDPFAGSCTTLRAAKDLSRKSIGIEIEEKYCEIGAKRLVQEVLDFGARKSGGPPWQISNITG